MSSITPEFQYQQEHNMQARTWTQVPYNYFFVVFYFLLAVAFGLHPVHRLTTDFVANLPFELSPRFFGQMVGALFFVLAFVLWQKEPKGKWITYSLLPAVIWGSYSIVNILGNDSSSWVTAVFIGTSIAGLVLIAEQRQLIESNEAINVAILKENIELKKALETAQNPAASVKSDVQ